MLCVMLFKSAFFLAFCVFGSCFRTPAVNFVSVFSRTPSVNNQTDRQTDRYRQTERVRERERAGRKGWTEGRNQHQSEQTKKSQKETIKQERKQGRDEKWKPNQSSKRKLAKEWNRQKSKAKNPELNERIHSSYQPWHPPPINYYSNQSIDQSCI